MKRPVQAIIIDGITYIPQAFKGEYPCRHCEIKDICELHGGCKFIYGFKDPIVFKKVE